MSHVVRVNAGQKRIVLPNGEQYDGQVDVTLTDEEFARIRSSLFPSVLTDLGSLADPDVDAVFATDAELTSAVAGLATDAELTEHADDELLHSSGIELAYAERTTNDTSTNLLTTDTDLGNNKISGLSITVVGTGTPVEVGFQTRVRHSVVNTSVSTVLLVNGVGQGPMSYWASDSSPSTSQARSGYISRRLLLLDGVTYVFELAKQIGAAGTGTWEGAAYWPMFLAAVQR